MKSIFKRMAIFILLAAYIFTGCDKELALNDPGNIVPKTVTEDLISNQKNKHKSMLKKLFFPVIVISVFTTLKLTEIISVTWMLVLIPIAEMMIAYVIIYLGGKALLKRLRSKRTKSTE